MVISYCRIMTPSDKRTSPEIATFEDLDCWKECRQLRLFFGKEIVPHLSKDEPYRLGDQVIRAARSTTANLAEGYGRFHYADNAKFCSNARGSAYELLDHLITALDDGLITHDLFNRGREQVEAGSKERRAESEERGEESEEN